MWDIVKSVLVFKRGILSLLAACAAHTCGLTQIAGNSAAVPQIIIDLPDNIPPEAVWVRYALYGPDGRGGRISKGEPLTTEANSPHYITIPALYAGTRARHGRLVLYAPGCQFAIFDLDLRSDSDVTKQFQCDPLPTKAVHGFLHPNEIPPHVGIAAEQKLDIAGYLDGNWLCEFFFQPWRGSNIAGGSCLGSEVPLGTVGQFDRAGNGIFGITIPDFTRDPVFGKFARKGKFGVIELALKEKKSGRALGTIKADNGLELGLNVQDEYRDPVIFTTVHN